MKPKDYALGATFECDGVWLKVIDDSDEQGCDKCYFDLQGKICKDYPCTHDFREEKNDVRFEELNQNLPL